jgi:hypothetical protein
MSGLDFYYIRLEILRFSCNFVHIVLLEFALQRYDCGRNLTEVTRFLFIFYSDSSENVILKKSYEKK